MIKINLLPVKRIQARLGARNDVIKLAVFLVVVLVVIGLANFIQQGKVDDLNSVISKLSAEKDSYGSTLTEIEKLKADKAVLETQLGIIKSLKQSSQFLVRVLDEVSKITPPNLVWLQSLVLSHSTLQITCMAVDNPTVAQYMEAIEASPYLSDPELPGTTLVKDGNRERRSFSLNIKVQPPSTEGQPAGEAAAVPAGA